MTSVGSGMQDGPSSAPERVDSSPQVSGVINCAVYEAGCRVADVPIPAVRDAVSQPDGFVWVGLFEPSESLLREVQAALGLHDLAIEDAHRAHQRPKVERYEDALFVVLRTAQLSRTEEAVEFGETHIFVGERYVVTVRHGSLRSHVGLRARCEAMPQQLRKGPGFVLYALMDFVVDQYFPIVETFEDRVAQIEAQVFGQQARRETLSRIYNVKRDLLALKRAVSPLVEVCTRLMRYDIDVIPEETRPYFRDVYDHVVRINEMIDAQRELLTTALDANLSLLSVSQNEDTRRLAAWAAIFAVPTMIAGVYGMNFQNMPELQWRYGYLLVVAGMVVVCNLLYRAFKRSGWL